MLFTMDALYAAPSKTHSLPHQPADTAFPTVYPDPPIYQHASKVGDRTLWVVFVFMVLATIAFAAMAWTVPAARRLHHSLTTLMVVIAGLSYFAMANKSGVIEHHRRIPEHHTKPLPPTHRHVWRDVYFARYIDWLLTTPLLVLNLSVLAGLNGASIFSAIAADVVMILSGWFAAVSHRKAEKWGWYTIALLGFIWVIYTLVVTGSQFARTKNSVQVTRFYQLITGYTVIVWIAYPVIWAIAGRRILSVDGEIIAYAVLDILSKIVFGAWLLSTHRKLPEAQREVGGFWAHGFSSEGQIRIGNGEEA